MESLAAEAGGAASLSFLVSDETKKGSILKVVLLYTFSPTVCH